MLKLPFFSIFCTQLVVCTLIHELFLEYLTDPIACIFRGDLNREGAHNEEWRLILFKLDNIIWSGSLKLNINFSLFLTHFSHHFFNSFMIAPSFMPYTNITVQLLYLWRFKLFMILMSFFLSWQENTLGPWVTLLLLLGKNCLIQILQCYADYFRSTYLKPHPE